MSFLSIGTTLLVSVIIIWLGHILWNRLKDTYSKKKTKDLVNTQIQKYKQVIEELQSNPVTTKPDTESMRAELEQFLASQE
jgi:predicted negative regulator of RcsB-dependent stress response